MVNKRIYLSSPHMSAEGYELQYILEAFDTNWIAPLGPNVDQFEQELAARIGAPQAAALNTGTAALHLALRAAGAEEGDTVICPTLTFSASANPIIYQGATPVFIDSDPQTWNMDPAALEQALEKYPRAKAVIVVHLYGLAAEMNQITDLCRHHGVTLIEDAAESLGTTYKGRHTGTIGDFGVFSFNGNKIITTSGGGMLVSASGDKIEKVRYWATQSRDPAPHYQHSELGFNYRMSNIVAGIGRGQLKVLDRRIARKKEIFHHYQRELQNLPGVEFMPVNSWNEPNYWLTCLTIRGKITPQEIIAALEKENIEARLLWKPLHLQPYFAAYDCIGGHIAEKLFTWGICLPSDTKMTDTDLDRICRIIKGVWS